MNLKKTFLIRIKQFYRQLFQLPIFWTGQIAYVMLRFRQFLVISLVSVWNFEKRIAHLIWLMSFQYSIGKQLQFLIVLNLLILS